ncbi:MAG: hypothetical protein SNH63_02035 [Rikenellaceae bacterium]
MSSENYIYQVIHTLAHHPLYVDEHCRLLEHNFMEVYFRPLYLDSRQIHSDIVALLKSQRVTQELSVYVEVRIDIEGEVSMLINEVSIYEGYVLRCIDPAAENVVMELPFGAYHTSVRRQVLGFANDIARNIGGDIAAECSSSGVIGSVGGGTPFGIINRVVVASTSFQSVERGLVMTAARECGLEVREAIITRNDLLNFDELFYCDHYGITSITRFAKRHYMSIITPNIAAQMATPWISPNSI